MISWELQVLYMAMLEPNAIILQKGNVIYIKEILGGYVDKYKFTITDKLTMELINEWIEH